ncbi:DUF302 domain-containing protein [Candidatus Venteria ishoeyi]|uniref:DUF302 domain-containing protein n=1 Tax=Candidatus Venteria ishoeyi TaxID=1899563 RepID=A0A1H6FCR1_9GAMM|nr:DUF302 domain-containing protein [Candidatus Venteria ishoeyi]MDM8547142.1 DUF302 domain-containing protein [Candidatus Venteria ishoeyi]SEH06795.1 Uncharacterised protein [Candidatus Venteria ishoeyi]
MLKTISIISLPLIFSMLFSVSAFGAPAKDSADAGKALPKMILSHTTWQVPLEEGISLDDAIDSMKLRANSLNMKLVGHQPLSNELEAQGLKNIRRMEIFQFCDAQIANKMVRADISFAAYLPCRITVVVDENEKPWLVTLNMDMVLSMVNLTPELQTLAKKVRDNMHSIIHAGAAGDL